MIIWILDTNLLVFLLNRGSKNNILMKSIVTTPVILANNIFKWTKVKDKGSKNNISSKGVVEVGSSYSTIFSSQLSQHILLA